MEISYGLLSGGKSKRFGRDKTLAKYKGKPLYLHALEVGLKISQDVMHISKDRLKYQPYLNNVRYLEDDFPEICPLSGLIKAGMEAKYNDIFIISADAPLINDEFVRFLYTKLQGCDGVVPIINNKKYTLMAFYKRDILKGMVADYNNKNYKISKIIERYNINYVREDEIFSRNFNRDMFINVNYEEDLKRLI